MDDKIGWDFQCRLLRIWGVAWYVQRICEEVWQNQKGEHQWQKTISDSSSNGMAMVASAFGDLPTVLIAKILGLLWCVVQRLGSGNLIPGQLPHYLSLFCLSCHWEYRWCVPVVSKNTYWRISLREQHGSNMLWGKKGCRYRIEPRWARGQLLQVFKQAILYYQSMIFIYLIIIIQVWAMLCRATSTGMHMPGYLARGDGEHTGGRRHHESAMILKLAGYVNAAAKYTTMGVIFTVLFSSPLLRVVFQRALHARSGSPINVCDICMVHLWKAAAVSMQWEGMESR